MALPKRSQELNAADHVKALKHYERMNEMERIEKYKDSVELCSPRPGELSEVERREELEIIGRVVGLLERVVLERFPRVRERNGA